jgi:hypothetical protein
VRIKRTGGGRFTIESAVLGLNGPVEVVPPNPGTDAFMTLAPEAGDRYCVQYGPESHITNDGPFFFSARGPVNKGCPPTTTTTTTTNPSLCGNGTLDPGEACDGGPSCGGCRVLLGSECCERSDASGVCSGLISTTGFSAEFTCIQFFGGTRFQWGGAPPAGGEPCPSGVVFPFVIDGPCGPPATFPPTSFCYNPGVVSTFCRETVASDVAELSSWLVNQCNQMGTYPAAVGRCAESSPGAFVCTPGT